ncbi:inactive beta-amylase 4, chloroplastic isoform X2 [Beta vulgaris subsp. vulgaris]|uniref:inactive beta-amylase 4, chloroplastic isoform X2 n=1 Tax=Beta vulgaris subsp. vulgaris TaxID=3555 RepID=UPI002036D949|nr:inactive beta-amylase 4, chloroplastic isoform X2 [Beta vulgaris subsp. vulgaris]
MADVLCKCSGRRNCYAVNELLFEIRKSRNGFKNLRNVSTIVFSPYKKKISKWRSIMGKNSRVFSMDAREKSRSLILKSSKQKRVPVFVMMPLDSFGIDTLGTPRIKKIKALSVSLKALKLAGVHGIAVEVWWGIVEHTSPHAYDWSLYEELFKLISEAGLKLHIALCFHSNVHLSSQHKGSVSLPFWIQKIGAIDRDIYYRDQHGNFCDDYLSLGVDELPLFCGRTALQCYEDFIFSFLDKFDLLIGHVIEEISVGLGPSGELRYPAHAYAGGRWRFPGIGEFQCYDKYMMEDLRIAACLEGRPQWGGKGPQDAGCYNSSPSGVPFFEGGQRSFLSDYGHFFLEWYSGKLLHHADAILGKAADMLKKYQQDDKTSVLLVAKIGAVYWWYQTLSHAAELTAGYYNTAQRDGYDPLALVLFRHGAALHISCLEMMDSETPPGISCSPEGLLQQLQAVSKRRTISLTGRNYNERFDKAGLQQIQANCYNPEAESVRSFTYFRLSGNIFKAENWCNFVPFVRNMNAEQ